MNQSNVRIAKLVIIEPWSLGKEPLYVIEIKENREQILIKLDKALSFNNASRTNYLCGISKDHFRLNNLSKSIPIKLNLAKVEMDSDSFTNYKYSEHRGEFIQAELYKL